MPHHTPHPHLYFRVTAAGPIGDIPHVAEGSWLRVEWHDGGSVEVIQRVSLKVADLMNLYASGQLCRVDAEGVIPAPAAAVLTLLAVTPDAPVPGVLPFHLRAAES